MYILMYIPFRHRNISRSLLYAPFVLFEIPPAPERRLVVPSLGGKASLGPIRGRHGWLQLLASLAP